VKEVIVDTGPLVALMDDTDEYYGWAVGELRRLHQPLRTCDAVLSETSFLLAAYPKALRQLRLFLERELIVSDFASRGQAGRLFGLMERYGNVPMSFTDACLVCLVENHPGATLFTLDHDFTIYRQQRRRVIPLIAPF
jgi:predicted nucleic acid-binding protein